MRRTAREIAGLFGETLHRCVLHGVDTQSAALAFYSLLALAPALLAVVAIGGRFLTEVRVHEEIVRQQAEYLRRGGRFVVPVPRPRVLDEPAEQESEGLPTCD